MTELAHRSIRPLGARIKLLEMQGIAKVFNGTVTALQGMNLDLNEGDFLSLLGPSGCGKSTALRLIAGLMQPTHGRILWSGGQQKGDLGVVFQEPTLMPWATVAQNVYLPFRLRGQGFGTVRSRVAEALDLVGLANFHDAFPRELSGGMKMRVSIARALVTKPKLLLMDEPFAALDEITRQKLNDDVLRLWRETGITVIFVTHSVFESAFLSNRIVVMRARPGQVYADLPISTSAVRDANFRTSEEYRATTDTVSRALQEAIHVGAAAP
jgi:NitT/TauT family transport system ATP-binding protein